MSGKKIATIVCGCIALLFVCAVMGVFISLDGGAFDKGAATPGESNLQATPEETAITMASPSSTPAPTPIIVAFAVTVDSSQLHSTVAAEGMSLILSVEPDAGSELLFDQRYTAPGQRVTVEVSGSDNLPNFKVTFYDGFKGNVTVRPQQFPEYDDWQARLEVTGSSVLVNGVAQNPVEVSLTINPTPTATATQTGTATQTATSLPTLEATSTPTTPEATEEVATAQPTQVSCTRDDSSAEWGEQVLHQEGGDGKVLIDGLPAVESYNLNNQALVLEYTDRFKAALINGASHDPWVAGFLMQTFGIDPSIENDEFPDPKCVEVRQEWTGRIAQFLDESTIYPSLLGEFAPDGVLINDGVLADGTVASFTTTDFDPYEPVWVVEHGDDTFVFRTYCANPVGEHAPMSPLKPVKDQPRCIGCGPKPQPTPPPVNPTPPNVYPTVTPYVPPFYPSVTPVEDFSSQCTSAACQCEQYGIGCPEDTGGYVHDPAGSQADVPEAHEERDIEDDNSSGAGGGDLYHEGDGYTEPDIPEETAVSDEGWTDQGLGG